MTRAKPRPQNLSHGSAPNLSHSSGKAAPPMVSARWLLSGLGIAILAAMFCAWCALCLLFWLGSWQLIYHPASAVTRTPATAGLPFDAVEFAATDEGVPRLKGWWIPVAPAAPFARYTVLFLHGQDGNLSEAVDALARLHAAGVNVLAFDYRGYGQSRFVRPSEAHWRQDTDWALQYLTETRHVNPGSIVLDGEGLGANLALEVAAAHPELAGVVLNAPIQTPMNAVFNDARARMVPARLLVRDRYDLDAPAGDLRIPLLWFEPTNLGPSGRPGQRGMSRAPEAFQEVTARKIIVFLNPSQDEYNQYEVALSRWLDSLHAR